MRGQRMTTYIVVALVLGIVVGTLLNKTLADSATATAVAGYISVFSDIFLRLIKMIIAPLVFSTLVVGIAHMGDAETIGRIGAKALGWFVIASLVSLLLGMVLVNLFRPGEILSLPLPDPGAATNLKTASFSLKEFVTHLVPTSVFQAMAKTRSCRSSSSRSSSASPYAASRRTAAIVEDDRQVRRISSCASPAT